VQDVTHGPQRTSKTYSRCCGAARHSGRSCIAQHFVGSNVGQQTEQAMHAAFDRLMKDAEIAESIIAPLEWCSAYDRARD
jgi:hypothetical protein